MESFDRVWKRLMDLEPSWTVAILSASRPFDTVNLTWLSETAGGVLKTTLRYQEVEYVGRTEWSKLEVLFFPDARLDDKGGLNEKMYKTKSEVHKTELEVRCRFKKGFLGLGGGVQPECPVPREHAVIREYARSVRARHEEEQCRVRAEEEKSGSDEGAAAYQAASRAFFGS